MRNLIRFIIKNNFYFLFLLLQTLSLYLLYLSHTYQGSILWNTSKDWAGKIFALREKGLRYLMLDDINRMLMQSYLQKLRCNSKPPEFPGTIKSSSNALQYYEFLTAEVVDVTKHYQNNYLTITGGSKHGVVRDMGVFSPSGIVGIVQDVSENFSLVMSVLHLKFKVNCEIKKNGIYGMLQWNGSSPYYAELTDLPNHTKAIRGDTIVTGKLSGMFPAGIPVGVVEYVERKQNEPFLTAHIRLTTEWGKLHQVFVVKNKYLLEADSLKIKSINAFDKP
ncbi:MAG: rod shape-determining protein MreC [Bacteroidia bacterium]|nr:rod shape-determining protein MreC [Bacteroidia bacterium]